MLVSPYFNENYVKCFYINVIQKVGICWCGIHFSNMDMFLQASLLLLRMFFFLDKIFFSKMLIFSFFLLSSRTSPNPVLWLRVHIFRTIISSKHWNCKPSRHTTMMYMYLIVLFHSVHLRRKHWSPTTNVAMHAFDPHTTWWQLYIFLSTWNGQ